MTDRGKPTPTSAIRDEIASLTEARLTLGPRGRAVDTGTSLRFALDHARAREAVMAKLDGDRVAQVLAKQGLASLQVTSAAATRDTFIRRPDLGRILPSAQADTLAASGKVDVAIVLGDGLSGLAANLAGPAFVVALGTRLAAEGLSHEPVIIAHQARVALGDPIAVALGAKTVVVALGERPGLSAADSLGVYITHDPRVGMADSARNCLSNIRDGGMNVETAVDRTVSLIRGMRQLGKSGVPLSQALAARGLPGD
jgi:ethanolamine ammonia-lyase small subunit